MMAAVTKIRWYSVPIILVGLIEILIAFLIHVTVMLIMKKSWNLGILIAACCVGGFALLYLFYLWAVSIAMFQIFGIVKTKQYQQMIKRASSTSSTAALVARKSELSVVATVSNNYYDPVMLQSDFIGMRRNIRRI
jgi:membrane protein implicated in regulation of membrane protease activity